MWGPGRGRERDIYIGWLRKKGFNKKNMGLALQKAHA